MRFQIIFSLAVLGLATSVSAEGNSTTPAACEACLLNGIQTSIPSCTNTTLNSESPTAPSQMTPVQKNCFCTLLSTTSWATGCVSSNTCPQDEITEMTQEYSVLYTQYCAGFFATGGKNGAMDSKNIVALMTATLVAATMSAAMMFL